MNATRRILIAAILGAIVGLMLATIIAIALPGPCAEPPSLKPAIPAPLATPAPSAMPSGGAELTILASGSGVTILEYQGAGVDMVCQTAPTTPAQPTPDGPDKHQVPNGSSDA